MLRRAATVCAPRVRFALAACPVASLGQRRWATTTTTAADAAAAAAPSNAAAGGASRRNRLSNAQRQRGRRESLWPAFDLVHWNDDDITAGYLLRVAHRDGFISLDYHRQNGPSVLVNEDGSRRTNLSRAERVVTVTLPPVYVARFLSVLEGRAEKVVVQSRFTNANFAPNPTRGPHCYSLQCTSMKPTSGQIQTADGADVEEETIEWSAELDAAESLMLHRFLSQSLHYNTGFSRTVADNREDSEELHEPVNGTMEHKQPHYQHDDEDGAEEEAEAAYGDAYAYGAPREASGSAEAGSAGAREGTVPPLDQRSGRANEQEPEEEGAAEEIDYEEAADAAPPAAPATAHANGVPALPTTPRAYHANGNGYGAGVPPQRHAHAAATPRGTALSPRSASGISRGHSYSVGGHSAGADPAEVFEQHYRRCTSIVKSARSHSARRASAVNGVMGYVEEEYAPTNRRASAMTAGERMAVERMMENELRRQEAFDRSAQFALVRESAIVETELAREKANYARRVRLDEELHNRLEQSSRSREERTTAAAQRREVLEAERVRAVFGSVAEKESRYHTHDPYALLAANRRYSATLRAAAAIAPQRRTTSPSHGPASRRASAPAPAEAAATTGGPRRSSTPRIDMSRPRQCLSVNDWKTPEQLRREAEEKNRANRGPTPVRCLSPKAWRAPTVVDHPRQWH